jgi:predicted amidohydrolase
VAEPIPEGQSTDALRQWAGSLDATIVAGLAERKGERFYNSAVVVRPTGVVQTYRKVHLFYEETTLFKSGDLGFRVFDETAGDGMEYRLGVMVCFELSKPDRSFGKASSVSTYVSVPSRRRGSATHVHPPRIFRRRRGLSPSRGPT